MWWVSPSQLKACCWVVSSTLWWNMALLSSLPTDICWNVKFWDSRVLPLGSCVTLSKRLNLFTPPFALLYNGNTNSTWCKEIEWFSTITKLLSQGLAHSKLSSSENRRRLPNKGLVDLQYLAWFWAQICFLKKWRQCGAFHTVIIMLDPVHPHLLRKPDPNPCCEDPKSGLLNAPTLPSSEPQAKIQTQEEGPWFKVTLLERAWTSSLTSAEKSLPPFQLSHLHAPFLCLYCSLHVTCPSHPPSCCPTLMAHGKGQLFHGPISDPPRLPSSQFPQHHWSSLGPLIHSFIHSLIPYLLDSMQCNVPGTVLSWEYNKVLIIH